MFLFSTNTNPDMARTIAKLARLKLGRLEIKTFSDGELCVRAKERVRGKIVWVIGSTMPPAENFLKLLILVNALKINGAKKINLIIPYFGYGRQDWINKPGAPLSAKMAAEILGWAGAGRIIAVDLHSERVANFFKVPLIHFHATPLFAGYFKNIKNLIIVSPDKGGTKGAEVLAKILHVPAVVLQKIRPRPNAVAKITPREQDVQKIKNKNVIIIDDLIDTAGTITKAALTLKNCGAKDVYVAATHGVLSGPAISRIKKSPIRRVVITNTFPLTKEKRIPKIKVISVAPLLSAKLT